MKSLRCLLAALLLTGAGATSALPPLETMDHLPLFTGSFCVADTTVSDVVGGTQVVTITRPAPGDCQVDLTSALNSYLSNGWTLQSLSACRAGIAAFSSCGMGLAGFAEYKRRPGEDAVAIVTIGEILAVYEGLRQNYQIDEFERAVHELFRR